MAEVGASDAARIDKTGQMQARAWAVEELQAAGTFEYLTALGPAQDDVDRQLDQLGAKSAVDDELAKLKAESGSSAPRPPSPGEPASAAEPEPRQAGGREEPGSG